MRFAWPLGTDATDIQVRKIWRRGAGLEGVSAALIQRTLVGMAQ